MGDGLNTSLLRIFRALLRYKKGAAPALARSTPILEYEWLSPGKEVVDLLH